ncbi:MAG: ABC transporter permease [Microthrixaceae bacterium]
MVKQRLPASLRLAIFAMLIEASIGIGSGVLSARRRGSIADTITTSAAVVAGAIPVFVLGYLITLVTGVYAFEHDWPEWARFPAISNNYDPTQWYLFIIPNGKQFELLIQPAIVLASVSTAIVARLTRTTMLEAQTADHVRTARAKGLSEKVVSRQHVLRNALIPVVTFIGIDFGTLIGFAILTETVFQWPGLGSKVATAAGPVRPARRPGAVDGRHAHLRARQPGRRHQLRQARSADPTGRCEVTDDFEPRSGEVPRDARGPPRRHRRSSDRASTPASPRSGHPARCSRTPGGGSAATSWRCSASSW